MAIEMRFARSADTNKIGVCYCGTCKYLGIFFSRKNQDQFNGLFLYGSLLVIHLYNYYYVK